MKKYPLASSTWDEKEIEAINEVVKSEHFTMGERVEKFEKNMASYHNVNYAVMVNSGSSANLLAVAALFYRKNNTLKSGDEVIVPAVSWSTSYYPFHQYGLKLKFVDIDLETLNYDLEQLEGAISERTKIILAVNLLGNPNDFDRIQQLIENKDIILLEDNCESMGARFNGRFTGTFGLMGTFSSYFSHHISTMEGGIVLTDDEELYHILLSLRSHGWTRHLPKKNKLTGIKSDNWFEESFKFVLPGYNVRPLEMSGAIGIEQLKKLPEFVKSRQENHRVFSRLFEDHPYIQLQKEIGESSWFGFSMILKKNAPVTRDEFIKKLTENNIESRPIVSGDFSQNEVLKYFDFTIHGNLNNAKYLNNNGLFIGNNHYDLKEQLEYLLNVVRDS